MGHRAVQQVGLRGKEGLVVYKLRVRYLNSSQRNIQMTVQGIITPISHRGVSSVQFSDEHRENKRKWGVDPNYITQRVVTEGCKTMCCACLFLVSVSEREGSTTPVRDLFPHLPSRTCNPMMVYSRYTSKNWPKTETGDNTHFGQDISS